MKNNVEEYFSNLMAFLFFVQRKIKMTIKGWEKRDGGGGREKAPFLKSFFSLPQAQYFTLVEVIVAMAVMALALTAFFALSQSAVNRIDKAYANWERTHLLSQAAEYYLLFADEEPPDIPPEVFESNNYDVEMRYEEAENLPEELNELSGQAPLRTLIIDLVEPSSREVVDTLKIDRIDWENTGDMDE